VTVPSRVSGPGIALALLLALSVCALAACNGDDTNGPGGAGDADGDNVADGVDNCPFNANPSQSNADADAFGDVCDCTTEPAACPRESTTRGNCTNGADDDGDQLVDAADPNCTTETTLSGRCGNLVDDDGDTLTDCLDGGCQGAPGC
jgi:hypothetical protein